MLQLFQGQVCNRCDVKIHNYCAKKFFNTEKRLCPKKECKEPWPDTYILSKYEK